MAMNLSEKFRDLEETGETLVALFNSAQVEKLRRVREEHGALLDQHLDAKTIVTEILKGRYLTGASPSSCL